MISRFTFERGGRVFEVLVKKIWTATDLEKAKILTPKARAIFLEEDDFKKGADVLAFDFFVMKNKFKLLSGKDFISKMNIDNKNLKLALELEIRKLASSARFAYFLRKSLLVKDIMVTLDGLKNAIEYLNIKGKKTLITKKEKDDIENLSGSFFPRKRISILLKVLQKWEDLVN